MRFQLIDRITGSRRWDSITAVKLTSPEEDYWITGPDGQPMMPPELVLESLCQAGSWLVVESSGGRQRAALLSLGSVDVSGTVRPGDVLDLHGSVVTVNQDVAVLDGHVSVGGVKVLAAGDIMCALLDAGTLDDPSETRRMLGMLHGEVPA